MSFRPLHLPPIGIRSIELSERVAILLEQICLFYDDRPIDVVEDLILQLGEEIAAEGDGAEEGA